MSDTSKLTNRLPPGQPPDQWLVSWGLAGDDLDALKAHGEKVHFPAQATIFAEGDPADGMYLVLQGMVLVLGHDENGDEHTISIVTEGQSVGELGLLLKRPRLATVAAGLDSVLLKITPESMTHLESDHPMLVLQMYKTLATTLAEQWLRSVPKR